MYANHLRSCLLSGTLSSSTDDLTNSHFSSSSSLSQYLGARLDVCLLHLCYLPFPRYCDKGDVNYRFCSGDVIPDEDPSHTWVLQFQISRTYVAGRIAESGISMPSVDMGTLRGRDELWSTVINETTRFTNTRPESCDRILQARLGSIWQDANTP